MALNPFEHTVVTLLRSALRLEAGRCGELVRPSSGDPTLPLWKRVLDDGRFDWWITGGLWRAVFEPDVDGVQAAQALDGLGLLRRQDDTNQLIVAKVGPKLMRLYCVDGRGLADVRVPAPGYPGARPYEFAAAAGPVVPSGAATTAVSPEPPAEDNPATLLRQGVVKGLRMALDTLDLELDPTDRNYGALLRAKTALANTLINTQVRVDEAQMRQRRDESLLPRLVEAVKAEKLRLAALEPRRDRGGEGADGIVLKG